MICPRCKKRHIEQNRKKCSICLFKEAIYSKNYRKRNPNYTSSMQKVRNRYRAEGRCTMCGAFLNDDCDYGKTTCINCRENIVIAKQLR